MSGCRACTARGSLKADLNGYSSFSQVSNYFLSLYVGFGSLSSAFLHKFPFEARTTVKNIQIYKNCIDKMHILLYNLENQEKGEWIVCQAIMRINAVRCYTTAVLHRLLCPPAQILATLSEQALLCSRCLLSLFMCLR